MSQNNFDARVSALTVASQHWLTELGVWERLVALRVCPYPDMQVWDADGTGSIHFRAEEVHESALGHIVENRLLCAVLQAALQQHANVEIRNGCALAAVTLATATNELNEIECEDGSRFRCSLLIGADGGNSHVRNLAGFAVRQWSYEQQAIVATIHTEHPHQFTAWQRFLGTGPLAVLPLQLPSASAQHYSSIVWSCDDALAAELMALPDEAFNERLARAFESRLGRMMLASPRVGFALKQQHATEYVKPAVALVGDAAHSIHPLAGQGVNLGLADARVLAEVLVSAKARGEIFASLPTLSRYARERKGPNLAMMATMEMFKQGFGSNNLGVRWLRNLGLRFANRQLAVKRRLMQEAMGLSL